MREGEGIDYSILHCTSIPEKKKKKSISMLAFVRTIPPSLPRDFSYRARWKFLLNIQRELTGGQHTRKYSLSSINLCRFSRAKFPRPREYTIRVTKGNVCDF